jgi:CP family cyanate transporter-like MFS transporter
VKFLRWYIPIVIIVATLNLRPTLLTVGPMLAEVRRTLELSPFASGLLTGLPILALGLASAVAVPVGRKLGWNGGIIFSMLLIGLGAVVRSLGAEWTLYTGALLLGGGIGLANVFVPTLVKARLADRIGLAMGVYTMVLTGGALVSTAFTPMIFGHFHDWRPTLGVWAIPAFLAAVIALPSLIDNIRPKQRVAGTGLWKSPVAWAVTGYMGLQSALFYAIALWIGALILARGVALTEVAAALTTFYVTQSVSSLLAPIVLTKSNRQDIIAVALVACVGISIVAILYGPLALLYVFCGIMGVFLGGVFAVALTFQVIRARTPDSAAKLSSMAQFVGYCIASGGPMVLGLVSKWPDARLASTIWMLILAAATATSGWFAGEPRFVDDDAGVASVPAN